MNVKPIRWNIPTTQPTGHKTRKDVYAVQTESGRKLALCVSCAANLDEEHEFAQCKTGDVVVRVPCQGCGGKEKLT